MAARPRICVTIVSNDPAAIKKVEPLADLFEVRIDLIGSGWREVAQNLKKPWIACNRRAEEGGKWKGNERERIDELIKAIKLGASIIDIERGTPMVASAVASITGKADLLLSYHNFKETPSLRKMREIIKSELAAGADICKVVTTAHTLGDNISTLQLIKEFPDTKVVSFAMGAAGQISRVLCPLAGGYFTYASIAAGKESAKGQVTAGELRKLYRILQDDR
ncbi:MAG: hypothetical protein A2137_02340 [Chloroflexi bacterium RBG_16_58_8]|nr:MAG: hypothetical protein A2137_02340 [Chloroflexi bacterium RBG_16_58_8]